MKDNEVIDFGFVLKSLLKNWIIGLVIFIIVFILYYTFTVNLKKDYIYKANIVGLDSYQILVLDKISNKLNNLQNFDYVSFYASNTSALLNMDMDDRILMNDYIFERDKYNQEKQIKSRDQLEFVTENYIYSQIIKLSRDKSFFKNTIEKYKKENMDKLLLINNIISPQSFIVISDASSEFVSNLITIKVQFEHNSEFEILEDFVNFFMQNLNQVILENLINSI